MQLRPGRAGGHYVVPLLVAGAVLVMASATTCAQPFAPYSDFQAMSQSDLATLQVKLTYVGPQTSGIRSVAFTSPSNAVNMALFDPYHRSQVDYSNDTEAPRTFAVSTADLKSMIDNIASVSEVTDGNVDPDGYVTFTLLNTAGSTKVFEAVVNDTTGPALMDRMLDALKGNGVAVALLTEFGCNTGILPNNPPQSVEGRVAIVFSGLRREQPNGKVFVGTVQVTNTSATAIAAPLSLVVIRRGNAELLGETGFTCNVHPPGFPYVDLPSAGLAPGTTVKTTLRFHNPTLNKFDVRFRAFAGSGTR